MATPFLLGWINTRRERYIYLLPRVDKNRGTQRAFPSFLPSFYYPWRRHIQSWQAFVILHTGASERIFPQREVKKGWISQKSVGWLSSVEDRFPSPVETPPFPPIFQGIYAIRANFSQPRRRGNVYCDENQDSKLYRERIRYYFVSSVDKK